MSSIDSCRFRIECFCTEATNTVTEKEFELKGIEMEDVNPNDVIRGLIDSFHDYLDRYPNIKTLILGLSGGVDSGFIAAIAHLAVRGRDVELYGYSLPLGTNKLDEISRAESIGTAFCDKFYCADLIPYYHSLQSAIMGIDVAYGDRKDKIRAGNIKARMRMVYLYDKAQQHDGIVLSTDNYTEYLLGFWTLHGDVGDFGAIQNLWKTEVYAAANYLCNTATYTLRDGQRDALYACVKAIPTDGLGITGSDMDQILPDWKTRVQADNKFVGWLCYEKIDEVLQRWMLGNDRYDDLKDDPIIQRLQRSGYKRENPYNVPRDKIIS